jgi:hypothetical protein
MSSEQSARLLIDATTLQVRAVLLDPLRLPEWNAALRRVTGPAPATVGGRNPIIVRPSGVTGPHWLRFWSNAEDDLISAIERARDAAAAMDYPDGPRPTLPVERRPVRIWGTWAVITVSTRPVRRPTAHLARPPSPAITPTVRPRRTTGSRTLCQ